jgi:hypothetical protein
MKKQLAFISLTVVVFMSCATSPDKIPQRTGSVINNKRIAIVEIGVVRHSLTYSPFIDAGIYNAALSRNADSLKEAQKEKNENLYNEITKCFSEIYNVEAVKAAYPFADDGLALNYFSKDVKQQLIKICNENNSDYLVTIMSRFVTTRVWTMGIMGDNRLRLEIAIFDREGILIVSKTSYSTENMLAANNISGFKNLYNTILRPTRQTIIDLGK